MSDVLVPHYPCCSLLLLLRPGAQIGNVITFPIAALLCDDVGWESIFYVFGKQ